MTHPISLTRPLLVQLLAAAVLCPVAFARTKNEPEPVKPAATAAAKPGTGKPAAATQAKGQSAAQSKPASQPQPALPVKTRSVKAAPVKPDTSRLTKAQQVKAEQLKAQQAEAQQAEAQRAKARQAAQVKKNPPPPQKLAAVPQKPQTQGDGPPLDQRYDHRALIIPADELRARVRTNGMLNEEDCILMAIATSPELQKRRSQIRDRIAARQADKDWENPELRLSYASQSDDLLRNPYVERSFENYSATEDRIGNQTTTGLNGEVGFGEIVTDAETGTTTTTRYREIERIVTPGRFGDSVTTNVYETRTDASSGFRDRTIDLNGFVQSRRDSLEENVERTLRSTATETVASSAENGNQESFTALLRMRMPHPWVKKAKLARAAAEITLAEAQYLADEDKLVREVRALFQELSVKESTLKAHQKRRENLAAFRTELESSPIPDYVVDAARASIDLADVLKDSSKVRSDANNVRAEIAILCGVPPDRIYCPGIVTRRILDYRDLSQSYLVEMAMLYRADAVESRGRLGIAKALLEEAKAAKIPWATFIDAGYTRQWRDGYAGREDEWMIRVGIEIPFFDWTGINKRSREYRAAAVEWEKQFNMQRERIEMEVAVALGRVKRAYAELREFDSSVKTEQEAIQERLAKLETIGLDPGLFKNPRVRYAAADATQLLEIGRYSAYASYNEAMMRLEDTIGIRIEKVLSRAGK